MPADGSYLLVINVEEAMEKTVGSCGRLAFRPGRYAYAGSAFGHGGLARVERHQRLAGSDTATPRHWHIDHLLTATAAALADTYRFPGRDIECQLTAVLPGEPVDGFGATDCTCDSHLIQLPQGLDLDARLDTV